jgi:hypothetical protein
MLAVSAFATSATFALTSAPALGQTRPSQTFLAWGYGCIVNGMASLHDEAEPPTCAESGLQLGPVTFGTTPTETLEVQDSNGRQLDAAASRTTQPIDLLIRKEGALYTEFAVRPTGSRTQRHAINMSTVELDSWTWRPTRISLSRDKVFGLLPTLAKLAPNATIRTARTIDDRGFVYGAQIRDTRLTKKQRSALISQAKRRGIPIRVITQPAEVLTGTCPGIPLARQLNPIERLDLSTEAVVDPNAFATSLTCDEASQVQVLQQSVVGRAPIREATDLVVDASLRIVTSSSKR